MTCPRCGAKAVAGARFCNHCGARLAEPAGPSAGVHGAAPAAPRAPQAGGAAALQWTHVHGSAEQSLHYLVLGGIGVVLAVLTGILLVFSLAAAQSFAAFVLSVILAVLPVPVYVLLITSLERHVREPWPLLLGAFLWGAIVASFFAVLFNNLMLALFGAVAGPQIGMALAATLTGPFVEETAKGVALLLVFLFLRQELDDVVDGIVVGALVGLGFAMTENIMYFGRAYHAGGLLAVGALFYGRVILFGFGHALFTAATGAGFGLAEETDKPLVRRLAPVAGWATAIFLHFMWNTLSVLTGQAATGIQLFVLWPLMTLFLILPGIAVLVVIAVLGWRRESKVIAAELKEEVDRGVIRPGEYALLCNDRERTQRIWHILFTYGPLPWHTARQFYNQQIALAFRKWHTARAERLPAFLAAVSENAYREHIGALRVRLHAMGVPTE